jgi:hypothetical protein
MAHATKKSAVNRTMLRKAAHGNSLRLREIGVLKD